MARDKKVKKGLEEETGEEVVSRNISKESTPDNVGAGKPAKKGKKGKKDPIDHVSEDADVALEEKVQTSKKTKKPKNLDNEDASVTEEQRSQSISSTTTLDEDSKKEKRSKKSKSSTDAGSKGSLRKKKGVEVELDEDSDFDDDSSRNTVHKKVDKPAGFGLLDIEGEDVDEHHDSDEQTSSKSKLDTVANGLEDSKKGGKKSKKKERKKKNEDDDEDLDKLLAELALEMNGEPAAQVTETAKAAEVPSVEVAVPDTKSKKKKKKGTDVEASDNVEVREPSVEVGDEEHQSSAKTALPKKTEKKEKVTAEAEVGDTVEKQKPDTETGEEEQQSTVKTAAQKKKEKKEKEKQKKAAQFEQQSRSSKKTVDESKSSKSTAVIADAVAPEAEAMDMEEEKDDGEGDDKKKKKKKKKDDDDDKKDKKRPGKRQIAAMQEALKKVREEEERLRLEEEAKIKAAEEAEKLRLEKLRLEQERKEKKKQKEKEKRERLKAEGKLLSKTQRQNKARMEATLAALRQQGVEVPQIGEKKERAPRLGDRKRQAKKRTENSQDDKDENTEVVPMDTKESSPETEAPEEKMEEEPVLEEEEEEDVKDAWDESSEEESEESSKVEIVVKDKRTVKDDVDDSESEDSESTDEDSESDESSSESEGEGKRNEEKIRERVLERIRKRREENEANRSTSKLRSPVVCVLGHVDTGKTKILDKIRRTNVQDGEAGGITQQIGATMVPQDALKEQCKMVKSFTDMELKLPGLLIIDTPGHESFSNLRSRGSSLCDIAILVVDIMHGLEPQTIESINLLKQKKTPFIVALNKVDRLYEWKPSKNRDIQDVVKSQARNTKMEFEDRAKEVILQFATQGLNAVLHYENTDPRSYISMVPTSAFSGDGMGNLMALVVQLTQSMMVKRLAFTEELQATVLEVKAIPGLGTTIDAILVNGRLREGDTVVLAGYEGAIVTQIRSLLMPQPLKELRVKNFYQEFKEVEGAQGVKIAAKDLDKTIAGLQLLVANHPDEVPILKEEVTSSFKEAMSSIKLAERGVYVQASTLGSLEALLDFLRVSKISYSGIRIGPVVKKDVMKASIMLEHDSQFAVILAFDVKIERDAQDLADSLGVKIFQADIIYHLFDKFMAYREELKNKKREEFKHVAIFPCKLRILPQFIFNSRDPIVVGVMVEAGVVKEGTPLCVPSKEFLEIGIVTTIEVNHKAMETARKGQEVCLKIEPSGGEAPKMYGRHFDNTDLLVSKITRQSIDVCKEYFRDDLQKTDWQLMVELKKTFQIL